MKKASTKRKKAVCADFMQKVDYLQPEKEKRSKYGNVITEVNGIKFDSKKEARRYTDLKLLERGGYIQNLRLQVPYRLPVNGIMVCQYIADFVYTESGKEVVEDVKGVRTDVYKLKKRLMFAVYKIVIKET